MKKTRCLVLDPRTNRIVEFEVDVVDYCKRDQPCFNGGTCRNVPQDETFVCQCPPDWTGKTCNRWL